MTFVARMRQAEDALYHGFSPIHQGLCTESLAHRAFVFALQDGQICNSRPTAARRHPFRMGSTPLAPATAGARRTGYRAAAFEGAAVTAYFVRRVAPLSSIIGSGFCALLAPAAVSLFVPTLALCLGEFAGGTPHPCRFADLHRDPQDAPLAAAGLYRILCLALAGRLSGLFGGLVAGTLLGAAMTIDLFALPFQVATAAVMACAFTLGAATGVLLEAARHLRFRLSHGDTISLMQAAVDEEAGLHARPNPLPAPFRPGNGPTLLERLRAHDGPQGAREATLVARFMALREAAEPARAEAAVAPFGVPQMAELPPRAQEANVHGLGRDAATRRSLSHLLSGPQPSQPQATSEILEPLRAYLRRLDAENGALAQRAHPAGCTVLRAAWTLLDGPVPRRGYQPLGNPAHTLDLTGEGHGIVPMARVAAILWQAIDQLPDQTAEATAIRDERRLAFVAAMAACVDDDGSLVCAPGQAQQLVMVLQGFVPGVQVEHYDAVVAVEEFVKVEELRLRHRLGTAGPFEPEQVRARLDEIYLAGGAVYVGPERDRLRRHLRDLAHMQYDVSDWAPPNVS